MASLQLNLELNGNENDVTPNFLRNSSVMCHITFNDWTIRLFQDSFNKCCLFDVCRDYFYWYNFQNFHQTSQTPTRIICLARSSTSDRAICRCNPLVDHLASQANMIFQRWQCKRTVRRTAHHNCSVEIFSWLGWKDLVVNRRRTCSRAIKRHVTKKIIYFRIQSDRVRETFKCSVLLDNFNNSFKITSTVTEYCDAVLVAAKSVDILVNPL